MKTRQVLALVALLLAPSLCFAATETANYPDGSLQFKVPLDAKNQRHGPYLGYFQGGKKIQERAVYEHGERHGLRQLFNENGALIGEEAWVHGKLVFGKTPRIIEAMRGQLLKDAAASVMKLGSPSNRRAPSPELLARALGSIRFYRYLADVPADVSYDDSYINQCQYGAELLAKINMLSHNPPRPPGMDDQSYQIGHDACGRSNIYSGGDIVASVDAYMDDSDASNIDRLGHRRWVLNPAMGKTGFGSSGKYATMYSFDHSREEVPDFQFVCFPPRGCCPASAFKPSMAWHISFSPAHYAKIDDSVTVAIYPVNASLQRAAQPLELNYKHVDTGGYGISNALIFRPKSPAQRNAMYQVVVTGVKTTDDAPAEVSYYVNFY